MIRFLVPLLTAAALGAAGSPALAQDDPILGPNPSIAAPAKPQPGRSAHKGAAQRSVKSDSDEAEKAARLAEGRRRFFEQSMGFDNGKSGPVTLTNDNGGAPAVGLKF